MIKVRPGPADVNGLLAALPFTVYKRLAPSLRRVRLDAGSTLYEVGATVDHAWFITGGIISLLRVTEDGDMIEAASVGREGVVGLSEVVRRTDAMFKAQVQISGEALRVSAESLRTAMEQGSELYELLFEYTVMLGELIAQGAVCNKFHTAEQRLARWLLTTRDRVSASALVLTHDNMAQLLGVSRSRISRAAGELQRRGLIHYLRGRIHTVNLEGLEGASCECYRSISQTISHFLPT